MKFIIKKVMDFIINRYVFSEDQEEFRMSECALYIKENYR